MNPIQAVNGGGFDAFAAKLNPTGTALVYSTYVGGNGDDRGQGLAVDPAGNAYVTGVARSSNFPTTPGAFQTVLLGGEDVFVTKVNATGTGFAYSTYLGGTGGDEEFAAIAVDASGNAYVAARTNSTDFPTTAGAFQTAFGGGPLDAFVSKLNPSGTGLIYSTYLGGSGLDLAESIAVDFAGNAYVGGTTQSANFPLVNAIQPSLNAGADAFVAIVNPLGTGLGFSTYLGGSASNETVRGLSVDTVGNIYMSGITQSTDFPTTPGAFQPAFGGGSFDLFVAKIDWSLAVTIDIEPRRFPNLSSFAWVCTPQADLT